MLMKAVFIINACSLNFVIAHFQIDVIYALDNVAQWNHKQQSTFQ